MPGVNGWVQGNCSRAVLPSIYHQFVIHCENNCRASRRTQAEIGAAEPLVSLQRQCGSEHNPAEPVSTPAVHRLRLAPICQVHWLRLAPIRQVHWLRLALIRQVHWLHLVTIPMCTGSNPPSSLTPFNLTFQWIPNLQQERKAFFKVPRQAKKKSLTVDRCRCSKSKRKKSGVNENVVKRHMHKKKKKANTCKKEKGVHARKKIKAQVWKVKRARCDSHNVSVENFVNTW